MSSLYFPIASMFVCVLLYTVFNNKERIENKETKVYSKMVLTNLFETTTAILIIIVAKMVGTNKTVYFLDRVDFILISIWCFSLYEYIYGLSGKNIVKNLKLIIYVTLILSLFSTPFKVLNYNDIIDTSGVAPTLVSIYCGIFAVLMLISLIKTIFFSTQKVRLVKYYPVFVFIGLIILSLILRKFWPTMVLEPFMISFINLIMFFTIENPDIKMIEQLKIAKESAEKYGNDKSNFIFNMSQNIREPLKNIENLSEEILDTDDLETINENIQKIKYSTQRLQYIVTSSLDISTMEAKNLKVINSKYDLRKIVEQINIKVKGLLKDKNIEYRFKISETLPDTFYGDPIRIKQILNTLLFNSIKYTENGFIELNIDSIIKQDICRLIINVEDSGCGIKSKDIDRLFEKHDVEECNVDNNKLTLDTLKKMVNYIGGTVLVQSAPKQGSKFTVTIDQKIYVSNSEDNIKLYYKGKLLFITGRDSIKKSVSKLINGDKMDIDFINGGASALKEIRSGIKYDLIFIDYRLDKLDYLKTCEKIKDIDFNIPIVLICDSKNKIEGNDNFSYILEEPLKAKELDYVLKTYIMKKEK